MKYPVQAVLIVGLAVILYALPADTEEERVYVLLYHSFLGKEIYDTDVSLGELRSQLEFFREKGFRFVRFGDVLKDRISGGRNILVMADDGNISVYRAYREVFRPLGIRPLLAIFPGAIGKAPYMLTWDQLKELSDEGCEVASHGFYHKRLTGDLLRTMPAVFHREIYESREVLRRNLGREINAYVFPYGVCTETGIKAVREGGYRCAFSLRWGPVYVPLGRNRDVFNLPRYMVTRTGYTMIKRSILTSAPAPDR